jgi:NAD(P)-dependent dehydrogenase (short-subunit alcohol dehydrogenase family)
VTGAAKRLGREIAMQFARQGWDVAVHYGRSEQEAQETIREIEMMGVKTWLMMLLPKIFSWL